MEPGHPLFFAVNLIRRQELGFSSFKIVAVVLDGGKEAGAVSFVAGGPDLLDLDQQRITVTIKGDILYGLGVPASFTFHPEFLARAAPEMGAAGLDGSLERGAIHPGHHQYPFVSVILDNRRN